MIADLKRVRVGGERALGRPSLRPEQVFLDNVIEPVPAHHKLRGREQQHTAAREQSVSSLPRIPSSQEPTLFNAALCQRSARLCRNLEVPDPAPPVSPRAPPALLGRKGSALPPCAATSTASAGSGRARTGRSTPQTCSTVADTVTPCRGACADPGRDTDTDTESLGVPARLAVSAAARNGLSAPSEAALCPGPRDSAPTGAVVTTCWCWRCTAPSA